METSRRDLLLVAFDILTDAHTAASGHDKEIQCTQACSSSSSQIIIYKFTIYGGTATPANRGHQRCRRRRWLRWSADTRVFDPGQRIRFVFPPARRNCVRARDEYHYLASGCTRMVSGIISSRGEADRPLQFAPKPYYSEFR